MKTIKNMIHYFFGKHKWVFFAKTYSGNEKVGHTENSYVFRCKVCHKQKTVKVIE